LIGIAQSLVTLAHNAAQCRLRTRGIGDPQRQADIIPEIELGQIALKMGGTAMLVDPDNPALEDAEKPIDRVGVGGPAHVLAGTMLAREALGVSVRRFPSLARILMIICFFGAPAIANEKRIELSQADKDKLTTSAQKLSLCWSIRHGV
jgi:hypothetical protein